MSTLSQPNNTLISCQIFENRKVGARIWKQYFFPALPKIFQNYSFETTDRPLEYLLQEEGNMCLQECVLCRESQPRWALPCTTASSHLGAGVPQSPCQLSQERHRPNLFTAPPPPSSPDRYLLLYGLNSLTLNTITRKTHHFAELI